MTPACAAVVATVARYNARGAAPYPSEVAHRRLYGDRETERRLAAIRALVTAGTVTVDAAGQLHTDWRPSA